MRRLALAALLVSLTGPPASALQSAIGGNSSEFLRIGAGARSLGMGDAYGPVAEGAEAVYWNPAGLALLKAPELVYARSEFMRFFHHDFAAYAHPVRPLKGALAVSYTRFSQESLPLVTNANVQVGSFAPQSHAIALGYGRVLFVEDPEASDREYFREAWNIPGAYRPVRERLEPWTGTVLAGVAVKLVREDIYDRSSSALAADGGLIFKPFRLPQLNLSFAFRNLGQKQRFIRESESLPAQVSFGAAYDRRAWGSRLLPAFELDLPYYGNPAAKLGVEYEKKMADGATAAVRAGYKTLSTLDLSPLSGVTFGLGLKDRKFRADFAFQPMAELGQVYRLGVGVGW